MTRVGIPRGLFYYYYYPLWKTFFNELGVEVVTSTDTNRLIVDLGTQSAVDEACFPVKVFFGHVKDLCKYQPDYIFIPRIVSIEAKSYICPKFMGVPDMIKACMPDLPPILDTLIDLSKTDKVLKRDIIRLGQVFGGNRRQIQTAYQRGLDELQACRHIAKKGYTLAEVIRIWEGEDIRINNAYDLNIGLLGHGYSLYDDSVSMDIINRLRKMNCHIYLAEMLERESVEKEAATIPKRVFWTLGRKMVGSALWMEKSNLIDGIIYVACFGCGPDSLVGEIIARKVKNKPFMLITIDEHTGEGGLVTRLEAFCDMLRRRRIPGEGHISAHG
ncbi:MAG: acyl-CoA dehydratase activase-related protein [Syntrophomonadaceae bacterium]|jgi:predicted nucleotide-binding protein (sugar kinase/HSP70/actin superfamily)